MRDPAGQAICGQVRRPSVAASLAQHGDHNELIARLNNRLASASTLLTFSIFRMARSFVSSQVLQTSLPGRKYYANVYSATVLFFSRRHQSYKSV